MRRINLIIFAFLILGISFGFFRSLKISNLQSPVSLKIGNTKQQSISWEIYMNKDFGYSLKYPKEWSITQWDIGKAAGLSYVPNGSIWQQAEFSGSNGKFEILVWENTGSANTRNWISWFRHEDLMLSDIPLESNTTISGIPAFSYIQYKTSKKKPLQYVFFGRDTKIYELVFYRDDMEGRSDSTLLPHETYDFVQESFVLLSVTKD